MLQVLLADCPVPLKLSIAKDGEEALGLISTGTAKPDLILTDLNMPKIGGCDVLECLKGGTYSVPPILVMSSTANRDEISRALAAGASDFLPKRTDLKAFQDSINLVLIRKWIEPISVAFE